MTNQQKIANEWGAYVTARMARKLSKSGKNVTMATLRSIAFHVSQAAPGLMEVDVMFKDSGRYIEMRTKMGNQIGRSVYENLEDWVRRRGVQSFDYIPGYRNSAMNVNAEVAIQRIALGIMFSRDEGVNSERAVNAWNTKIKRNSWWSSAFYGGLGSLYGRLLYDLSEDVINGVKEGMS